MSQLVVNDLFKELFEENERLIKEFSVNKRFVDVLQKYRHLLSDICSQNEFNINFRQRFDELEDEYNVTEKDIQTIITKTESKTTELRSQMKRRNTSLNTYEESEGMADISDNINEEDDENGSQNKTNLKFLSATDCFIEEDGCVITESDPKNPLILVVRMKEKCQSIFGYRCNWSDCQYVSVSKPKLETHLRAVHDRNGLFICQKCKEKFLSSKLLSVHLNSDHSKQYKCDYNDCGFQCRTRQHLTDHLRRHTGEKPYICLNELCGKGFATRQELRRHNNSVHSKESYVCNWPGCELVFKSQKALSSHQTLHI